MFGLVSSVVADIAAVRAALGSPRGGLSAARRDARELLRHRRIRIDTQTMTRDGMRVVLRTRVRLNGDTQTDIVRSWLAGAEPAAIEALTRTHFDVVTMALRGWAASLGLVRLATSLAVAVGSFTGLAATIENIVTQPAQLMFRAALTDWRLLAAGAAALLGVAARWAFRLRLRALFRGGLGT